MIPIRLKSPGTLLAEGRGDVVAPAATCPATTCSSPSGLLTSLGAASQPPPSFAGIIRRCSGLLPLCVLVATVGITPTLLAGTHTDKVLPFFGTGGLGYGVGALNPGPYTPHGMAKPGPDTSLGNLYPGWAHCGGYWYPDPDIRGFSMVHPSGIGVADYGALNFMPTLGLDSARVQEKNYRSAFSHDTEVAEVGYYAVTLDDTQIRVELSAVQRAAYLRYTFPASDEAYLYIDADFGVDNSVTYDAYVEHDPVQGVVRGWQHYGGGMSDRFGGFVLYFYAEVDTPSQSHGAWSGTNIQPGAMSLQGTDIGAYLGFATSAGQTIDVRVGLSYISIEQAELNLAEDLPHWGLEQARAENVQQWEDVLSAIVVQGGTETEQGIFYSALYRSMGMPTDFTEVGDLYLGFDKEVHHTEGWRFLSDLSLWDTYRTTHPLYTLVFPDTQRDAVQSLVRMWEQSGNVPRWPLAQGETGSMIGEPADILFAESLMKGITDWDYTTAWEAAGERESYDDWVAQIGYVPVEDGGSSVSDQLEYALADQAMSSFAAYMGEEDLSDYYRVRSRSYQNLFNPVRGFFQGRHQDGTWAEPFGAHWFHEHYAEGNAWQMLWFVPHDVPGLVTLLGGPQAFISKLERFFSRSAEQVDHPLPDLNYWHGNEPDIQSSYLFNYVGRPDLTADWVRWVMATKYTDGPDGLNGNDDGGTLSAWYVFSSIGLFPVPGQDVYLIGSPLFTRADLKVAGGTFTILANGSTDSHRYVQSATLNGVPLLGPWLRHQDIVGGGTLSLVMGPTPSTWGMDPSTWPPSGLVETSRQSGDEKVKKLYTFGRPGTR